MPRQKKTKVQEAPIRPLIRFDEAFVPSSRLQALTNGTSKSIGASCNVFKCEDNINSISEGISWSMQVLAYQGAPSVDFSSIRPAGSRLGTGGTASGAVSFMRPFDAVVSEMRREQKKNGAGIAYLDYKHPELEAFLNEPLRSAYKAVYVPMPGTVEASDFIRDEPMMRKLTAAYNDFKCFLVKRPEDGLIINLCTEVKIPPRGYCTLGAFNVSLFTDGLSQMSEYFVDAAVQMHNATRTVEHAANNSPLFCDDRRNNQFGLGVFGLASLLAGLKVTYAELNEAFERVFAETGLNAQVGFLFNTAAKLGGNKTKADELVFNVIKSYYSATLALGKSVRAAFCIQPTVSTAQRSQDAQGYYASPEIQPVIGLAHEKGVSTLLKSQLKGDRLITYAPGTPTIYDTSYDDYARTSAYWQILMDSTGLAHRHSHCFYGEAFDYERMLDWYTHPLYSRIQSLYYRLPWQVNPEAMDKSELWQEVGEGELFDGDINSIGLQEYDPSTSIECAC